MLKELDSEQPGGVAGRDRLARRLGDIGFADFVYVGQGHEKGEIRAEQELFGAKTLDGGLNLVHSLVVGRIEEEVIGKRIAGTLRLSELEAQGDDVDIRMGAREIADGLRWRTSSTRASLNCLRTSSRPTWTHTETDALAPASDISSPRRGSSSEKPW